MRTFSFDTLRSCYYFIFYKNARTRVLLLALVNEFGKLLQILSSILTLTRNVAQNSLAAVFRSAENSRSIVHRLCGAPGAQANASPEYYAGLHGGIVELDGLEVIFLLVRHIGVVIPVWHEHCEYDLK